jgi:hypothetical protein
LVRKPNIAEVDSGSSSESQWVTLATTVLREFSESVGQTQIFGTNLVTVSDC